MSFFKNVQDKLSGKKSSDSNLTSGPSKESVYQALGKVIDPDLGRDIVSLGFVTSVTINQNQVEAVVNLTTPACPVKDILKKQCESYISQIPGVDSVKVTMTATTQGRQITPTEASNRALGRVKNIIAVASGKGGVGKSTTAVNLAFALAKAGSKIGILDADIYGPSIPHMTGVGMPSHNQGDLIVPPEVSGIKIISIGMFSLGNKAAILRGPMASSVIKQFLTQVDWGELDYLVIDYPPGTGDIQLTLSQSAPLTGAVLVTTPQEVALLDVRKAISMFETTRIPVIGIVETMSFYEIDGKRHYIFGQGGGEKIARESGIPLLGQIPIQPTVTRSGDIGNPIVVGETDSNAAQAYIGAAGAIAQQIAILHHSDTDILSSFRLEWKN